MARRVGLRFSHNMVSTSGIRGKERRWKALAGRVSARETACSVSAVSSGRDDHQRICADRKSRGPDGRRGWPRRSAWPAPPMRPSRPVTSEKPLGPDGSQNGWPSAFRVETICCGLGLMPVLRRSAVCIAAAGHFLQLRLPGFIGCQHRPVNGGKIALRFGVGSRHFRNEGRRWIVCHEMACQLESQMFCRGRMTCKIAQHGTALFHAALPHRLCPSRHGRRFMALALNVKAPCGPGRFSSR